MFQFMPESFRDAMAIPANEAVALNERAIEFNKAQLKIAEDLVDAGVKATRAAFAASADVTLATARAWAAALSPQAEG